MRGNAAYPLSMYSSTHTHGSICLCKKPWREPDAQGRLLAGGDANVNNEIWEDLSPTTAAWPTPRNIMDKNLRLKERLVVQYLEKGTRPEVCVVHFFLLISIKHTST